MGKIVAEEIAGSDDIELAAGIEHPGHSEIGNILSGIRITADGDILPDADVWVDFSTRKSALNHSNKAAAERIPLVLAVTGFSAEEETGLRELSGKFPLLLAPNLSLGANILERLSVKTASELGNEFDIALTEVHHKTKLDAPSGTARRIARSLSEAGATPQILSIRGGGAIGEHSIRFIGKNEEVTLTHRAWSRSAFASGVRQAVKYIYSKPAGFYTPQGMLDGL